MSDRPISYEQYRKYRLAKLSIECGDVLETRFSSIEVNLPRQICRAVEAFITGFGLMPEEIVMHPTCLPDTSQQTRRLEVFLMRTQEDLEYLATHPIEGMAVLGLAISGGLADAENLPTTIQFNFDASMFPTTVAARFTMPLCDGCRFKQRYRAATTEQERDEILHQALQEGASFLKKWSEEGNQ